MTTFVTEHDEEEDSPDLAKMTRAPSKSLGLPLNS